LSPETTKQKEFNNQMRKLSALTLALTVSLVVLSGLIFNRAASAAISIGTTVSDFSLPDTKGNTVSLSKLKGKNGTVIVFFSARCPWVKAYAERIDKIAQDYKSKGVNVIGVNSNSTEPEDEVKSHASSFSFPMLIDKGNKIADQLGAERTPEVFLLDNTNKLVFHGAIDNNKEASLATKSFLRDAIDATLEGKAIEKSEVPAVGCTIKKAAQ
jgi:peroxiredoxin